MNQVAPIFSLRVKALGLLLILSVIYGFWQHFSADILPIHECRKSDSLTQAVQYFRGTSFLEPKTNWIATNGNQNAAAEFPIIYYLVGQIWKVTGYQLWIAKLLSLGMLFIGIISLAPFFKWAFQSNIKTLIFSGLVFSFPVLVYYADTLLPNVFSFAFLLLAFAQFFRFWQTEKKAALALFFIFLSLAVLIKITALIAVFAFFGAYTSERFFAKKLLFSLKVKKVSLIYAGFLLTLTGAVLWYLFAIQYNNQYGSTIFSTTIRPIWEVDTAEQWRIIKLVFREHSREIFPIVTWPIFCALFLWTLWSKKVPSYIKYLVVFSVLGVLAYMILWFWVFEVHDYYFIEILFFPLILIGSYMKYMPQWNSYTKWQRPAEALFLTVVFLNTISFTQIAAGNQNFIVKNTPFISSFIKGNWGWFYFNHQDHLGQLQQQKLAIQKKVLPTDTVLCFSDPYPNVHLTAIDRIGYTNYNLSRDLPFAPQIQNLIQSGASKLVVFKSELSHPDIQGFLGHSCYEQANIQIFDLKPYKK